MKQYRIDVGDLIDYTISTIIGTLLLTGSVVLFNGGYILQGIMIVIGGIVIFGIGISNIKERRIR